MRRTPRARLGGGKHGGADARGRGGAPVVLSTLGLTGEPHQLVHCLPLMLQVEPPPFASHLCTCYCVSADGIGKINLHQVSLYWKFLVAAIPFLVVRLDTWTASGVNIVIAGWENSGNCSVQI